MSNIHNRLQTEKFHRRLLSEAEADDTLLTVDVNLRTEKAPPPLTSPEGDALSLPKWTTLWELKINN